jgi:hypothetical protein
MDSSTEKGNLLVIYSSHRNSGTVNDGTIILPELLEGPSKLSLEYAEIPNTVYTFGDAFTFEEGVGGPKTVTLTGAYTGVALATYLTNWMTTNSTAGAAYSVFYNTTTGKFEFTTVPATAHSITIATANLGKRLGFTVGTEAAAATHTSTNVADLSPPKGCLFEIQGLNNSQKVMLSKYGSQGHFFIPLCADTFGIVDFFKRSMFSNERFIEGKGMKTFKYRLLDAETGQLLAIQTDWMLVLRVD